MKFTYNRAKHAKRIFIALGGAIAKGLVKNAGLDDVGNEIANTVIDVAKDSTNNRISSWMERIYEDNRFSSKLEMIYDEELNALINGQDHYAEVISLIDYAFSKSDSAIFQSDIINYIDEWRTYRKQENGINPSISKHDICCFLDKLYRNIEIRIASDKSLQEFWYILRNIRNTDEIQTRLDEMANRFDSFNEMLLELYNKAYFLKDSTSEYARKYMSPLCIHKGESIDKITLKDVFVMPDVTIGNEVRRLDEAVREYIKGDKHEVMLLLAHGGFGKTSFLSYMAVNKYYFCEDRPLHIIRLRDYSKYSIDLLCEKIADIDQRSRIEEDTVLVFDGLDELCMIKFDNEVQDKADEIIKRLVKYFYGYEGETKRKIIITSRPGFVSNNKEQKISIGGWDSVEIIKAQYIPFDDQKREQFVTRLKKADSRIAEKEKKSGCDYIESIIEVDELEDVYSSPFILYLICCIQLKDNINIDSSKLSNTWYLFRKIFHDLYVNSPYKDSDGNNELERKMKEEQELYYEKTCLFAYEMYKKGLGNDDVIRFDKDADIEKCKDCYALSCYFNKTGDSAIEFSHNYIRDFFIGEYILKGINSLLKGTETFNEEKGKDVADWCSENLLYLDLGFDKNGDDPLILDFIYDYFRSQDETYKNIDVIEKESIHFVFDHFADNLAITSKSLINAEANNTYSLESISEKIYNVVLNTQEIFSRYLSTKNPSSIKWFTKEHIPDVVLNGLSLKGADMTEVDLTRNNVIGSYYNSDSVFRRGFDPQAHGMVYQIREEELANELGHVPVLIRRKMRLFIHSDKIIIFQGDTSLDGRYDPVKNTIIGVMDVLEKPADRDSVIIINSLMEGETVRFGNYEWYILETDFEARRILIVSKYAVNILAFHDKNEEVSWEDCSLRRWLNNEFIEEFSDLERNRIVETEEDNPITGTRDKAFILSSNRIIYKTDLIKFDCHIMISNNTVEKNVEVINIRPAKGVGLEGVNNRFKIIPALWLSF